MSCDAGQVEDDLSWAGQPVLNGSVFGSLHKRTEFVIWISVKYVVSRLGHGRPVRTTDSMRRRGLVRTWQFRGADVRRTLHTGFRAKVDLQTSQWLSRKGLFARSDATLEDLNEKGTPDLSAVFGARSDSPTPNSGCRSDGARHRATNPTQRKTQNPERLLSKCPAGSKTRLS